MHVCPQCQVASIPLLHAFVAMPGTQIACSHCGAELKLGRGWVDVLAQLPIFAASMAGIRFRVPIGPFMLSLCGAAVAGTALWAIFVRYRVVDQTPRFKPHLSTPPRC